MDQEQAMVYLVNNLSLIGLKWQESQTINEPRENTFFIAHIAMVVPTLVVNSLAVVVIRKKERNGLNNLIVLGCMMNILTIMLSTFHNSPWFIMKSRPPCVVYQFIIMALVMWNFFIPFGIALFRYLMVCHSVFCHNHGGEKNVIKFVTRTLFFLSLLSFGVIYGIEADKSKTYLRCIGRMETLR